MGGLVFPGKTLQLVSGRVAKAPMERRTVRFEIESGSHSVTAYEDRIPTGAEAFDSGVMSDGGFEHTFDTLGTYDYYCTPHQSMGMVGRIVVGEPGGPAEDSMPPDGELPDSQQIVEDGTVSYEAFTSR
jgi:hypothetical protein